MSPIQSSDLGMPADHPVNLTNQELAARLQDLLPALPPLFMPLVEEAAERLLEHGD